MVIGCVRGGRVVGPNGLVPSFFLANFLWVVFKEDKKYMAKGIATDSVVEQTRGPVTGARTTATHGQLL